MKDKTVILTTLNNAWAEPNSIFDIFIESFKVGNNTKGLLKHLVVICLDDRAYSRCLASYPHCYYLRTNEANFTKEAFYMSSNYLDMMWRRTEFLGTILQMGYNFIFTVRN
ncbi:Nucleotide-diphospho-sugar transferase [Trema orientale]|uniref:Nucleotide-diphospho-sugar transferase n=1 Tax=Trema orientale TaxID=63057 RepID=A0A2P5CQB6_TREOI|nr:Nucleotide-diphospho-sugar transferase [Trema orientale]